MDGIERWMAAAEESALNPIFVFFNSYNVANDDSSQTLSEDEQEFQPDGDDGSLSRFIS